MSLNFNIATEGIRGGHSILATFGFGFDIQVVIAPSVDTGGGATFYPDLTDYTVTIKITRHNKVWIHKFELDRFKVKTLERILVTYKSINTKVENISIAVVNKSINIKNILVKAFKK